MDSKTIEKIVSANKETDKVMKGNAVVWSGQINPTIVPDSYIISADKADNSVQWGEGNKSKKFIFVKNIEKYMFIKDNNIYLLVDVQNFWQRANRSDYQDHGEFSARLNGYQAIYNEGATQHAEAYTESDLINTKLILGGSYDSRTRTFYNCAIYVPSMPDKTKYVLFVFSNGYMPEKIRNVGIELSSY